MERTPRTRPSLLLWALLLLIAGCGDETSNFSQHPGFDRYYAAHPRAMQAPTPAQQALLQRHRPRLWVDSAAEGPVSFYDDYIAQGTLRDLQGRLVSAVVGPVTLNRLRERPDLVFSHEATELAPTPVVFGRVDEAAHPALGQLRFLTYHFVFRHSGLVAGLPAWQALPLSWLADLSDWHQLDHYTAATLVLDQSDRPLALLLQQHNHQRSYLFGADLVWPDDGRPALVVARRSNELYPAHEGVRRHRVVRYLSRKTLPYLVSGNDRPWLSGDDITEAGREVAYRLAFVPSTDAFYSFQGFLGERRWLPGRDGPPGADYNTRPVLKQPLVALVAFNWRDGSAADEAAIDAFLRAPDRNGPAFDRLLHRFLARLAAASTARPGVSMAEAGAGAGG